MPNTMDIVNYIIHTIPTEQYIRSPDIRYNTAWWVGLNGVCDSWMHDGVTYSYGYTPPVTESYSDAWVIQTRGTLGGTFTVYGDSYGPLRALIILLVNLSYIRMEDRLVIATMSTIPTGSAGTRYFF